MALESSAQGPHRTGGLLGRAKLTWTPEAEHMAMNFDKGPVGGYQHSVGPDSCSPITLRFQLLNFMATWTPVLQNLCSPIPQISAQGTVCTEACFRLRCQPLRDVARNRHQHEKCLGLWSDFVPITPMMSAEASSLATNCKSRILPLRSRHPVRACSG